MPVLFLLPSLPHCSSAADQLPRRAGNSYFQMSCLISFPSVQLPLQYNKPPTLSTSLCVYIRSTTLFVFLVTSGENISTLLHLTYSNENE